MRAIPVHPAARTESDAGGSDDDEDLTFDQHSSRPCEMTAKLPLWDMTFHLKSLHKIVESSGRRGRCRQRLVSAACKAGAPSARRDHQDRFSYRATAQYPDLKNLPTQLAHYAYEYLRQQLGVEELPRTIVISMVSSRIVLCPIWT
jgi:hypothetical protein